MRRLAGSLIAQLVLDRGPGVLRGGSNLNLSPFTLE